VVVVVVVVRIARLVRGTRALPVGALNRACRGVADASAKGAAVLRPGVRAAPCLLHDGCCLVAVAFVYLLPEPPHAEAELNPPDAGE
jgi:hypothetical protein